MVGGQVLKRFAQRTANLRHLLQLFRRQGIEILVHRTARMDLVLDPVQARHQHRGIGEVGVCARIGEANFDALAVGRGREGNAAGGRPVAGRIGQQHRGFKAGDQALVAVGQRVGEGIERLGVLDDAADIEQAGFRQVGIARTGEERLAGLPDRLVHMHARTIVALDRLGHESGGLAIGIGDLVDHILVDLHVVAALGQRVELEAKFMLGGGDFVVMLFRLDAHVLHDRQHFAAHVLLMVHRRDGEITALDGGAMAQIAAFIFGAGVVGAFLGVDIIEGFVHFDAEPHIVEDEEFGFGAEIGGVANARRIDIGLGGLGDGARAAGVILVGHRLQHIADQDQRGLGKEGVNDRGFEIRLEQHVGLVDRLPAGDRRTVEHGADVEEVIINQQQVKGDMLPLALGIGEANVNILDVLLLDQLVNVGCGRRFLVGHEFSLPFDS